jgi:hypothetical protein
MTGQSSLPAARRRNGPFGRGLTLRLLAACFEFYLRATLRTARVEIHQRDSLPRVLNRGPGVVAVHWHGQLSLAMLFGLGLATGARGSSWPYRNRFAGLVKPNAEGLLFKACLARLRIPSIDTGPGTAKRVRELLAQGVSLITPADGPRGPAMQASDRLIRLAQLSNGVILPFACAASFRLRFGTWDRFILPLPFTRLIYAIGDPIELSPGGDETAIEDARKRLECALNELTAEAGRLSGHP